MRVTERWKLIRTLADLLSPMSQAEASTILQLAGTFPEITPEWNVATTPQKRDSVIKMLSERVDTGALVTLLKLALPDGASPVRSSARAHTASVVDVPKNHQGPIFLVHGHAQAILHEAVRVLERGTGRDVIVLHEQANGGRTILEKFEDHANDAAFAVVLLTGDDQGGVRTAERTQLRGRQNVIFELGFFFGKLGRRRVAVLLEADVEKPSDIDGLVYISLDEHGAWKQALAKELENAAIPVDRSRIP